MKNKSNLILTSLLLLLALPMMMGGTAYAKDTDNDSRASVSINAKMCPPGHYRAPGFLKNLFRKNRVACVRDSIAPVISNVMVSRISDTQAVISWDTNEKATSKVSYGTTINYDKNVSRGSMKLHHQVMLTGLMANTTYHYKVTSMDRARNSVSSVDGMFTTAIAPPDTTPPVTSQVLISGTSQNSVTISWKTNEPASTELSYGVSTSYGSSVNRPEKTIDHQVVLSSLSAGTMYHYQIMARDASGNVSASGDATLSTLALPVLPTISNLQVSSVSAGSATVSWHTNVPSSSRVYYSTINPLITLTASSVFNNSLTMDHTVVVSNLSGSTTYYFRAESLDANGNVAMSAAQSFQTPQ